ncbi:MAG: restriction endonuclease subunit S, partial [Dolichospermum sp.]
NQVLSVCTTSANTNINQDSLSNLTINLPSLQEQTKIANFLTTIDEKISQSQTYLETVKQYKQGLLQQMVKVAG